jgi:hypothetical protein
MAILPPIAGGASRRMAVMTMMILDEERRVPMLHPMALTAIGTPIQELLITLQVN